MDWLDRYIRNDRFASAVPLYSRVQAQDYMRLMRLVDKKPPGFPATDDMNRLLAKMIVDLEDAVANIYMNTIAAGHTPNTMMYPCPDCNGPISNLEDIQDAWENNNMLEHYWSLEGYLESDDFYGEDPDSVPDEVKEAFEKDKYKEGIFICQMCGMIKQLDELDQYMTNPFSGGREFLISDQIDYPLKYLKKIKEGDSFERKFPYFEGIIEWVHRSGDMSEWFLEGGTSTINKYRNSKLPSRYDDDQFGDWKHPLRRDKEWDWSKI